MNCKPGDLAIIIRESGNLRVAGNVVTVIEAAPNARFRLPDGHWHMPAGPDHWLVDFGKKRSVPCSLGPRMAQYGAVPDRVLRPLRGLNEPESIERLETLPT